MNVSKDWQLLARVWENPKVRSAAGLGNPDCLTPENAKALLDKPGVIFISNEHGGFILTPTDGTKEADDAGVYDLHTQFEPAAWGPHLVDFAREAASYLFTRTNCVVVRTFVPQGNRLAYRFAIRCGFVELCDSHEGGFSGKVLVYTLKKWVRDTLCQPQ